MQAAAGNLKKVSLELGGKSPNVVFRGCRHRRGNRGRGERDLLQPRAVLLRGFAAVCRESDLRPGGRRASREHARKIKRGPGPGPVTEMGPLVSHEQFDARVRLPGIRGLGKARRLVAGGRPAGDTGYFVEPTVLVDTTPGHEGGARGDLRAGGLRDAVLKRLDEIAPRRRTIRSTAWRRASGRGTSAAHTPGSTAARRHGVDQLLQRLRRGAAVRRLQAVRMGPRDGPRSPGAVHTGEVRLRSVFSPLPPPRAGTTSEGPSRCFRGGPSVSYRPGDRQGQAPSLPVAAESAG